MWEALSWSQSLDIGLRFQGLGFRRSWCTCLETSSAGDRQVWSSAGSNSSKDISTTSKQ